MPTISAMMMITAMQTGFTAMMMFTAMSTAITTMITAMETTITWTVIMMGRMTIGAQAIMMTTVVRIAIANADDSDRE